jgi:hypothetical protein
LVIDDTARRSIHASRRLPSAMERDTDDELTPRERARRREEMRRRNAIANQALRAALLIAGSADASPKAATGPRRRELKLDDVATALRDLGL